MNNFRPQGFSLLPSVVKNLLIINGLVFVTTYVLQNTIGLDLTKYFALYFPGSESFKPHQLVTHLFMHGNFFHLFSNMLALWMFGSTLENFWGPKRFFIFYFVTGLGAAFLHTAVQYAEIIPLQNAISDYLSNPTPASFEAFTFQHVPSNFKPVFVQLVDAWNANPNSISIKDNTITIAKELANIRTNVPTVGASGAVFGLLLAFGMLFPNTLIYIYFFFINIYITPNIKSFFFHFILFRNQFIHFLQIHSIFPRSTSYTGTRVEKLQYLNCILFILLT